MSDQTPDPVTAEIEKYATGLVPGAVQDLSAMWSPGLSKLPADRVAGPDPRLRTR